MIKRSMQHVLSVAGITILVATSCPNPSLTPPPSSTTGSLKFDVSGAKAVGAADINASRGTRAAGDAFGLVKVLEDGTIQSAMQIPEGVWLPKVSFIAKSPVGNDLYVAFQQDINYFTPGYTDSSGQWVNGAQESYGSFLHIKPDGSFATVLKSADISSISRVKNYSYWGADNYKPVSFDKAGNLYFISESFAANANVEIVKKYDPVSQTSQDLTAPIAGWSYETIEVSPDGAYLFVKGSRYSSGTSSSFFRVYPTSGSADPKNIYYSSNNSNVWVRGFKASPDGSYLVMNGYNIRGINGIMKADIRSLSDIGYSAIYNSGTSGSQSFDPTFSIWKDWDNKEWVNGLFTQYYGSSLKWLLTDGSTYYYMKANDAINGNTGSIAVLKADDTEVLKRLGIDVYFAKSTTDASQVYTGFNKNTDLRNAGHTPIVMYKTYSYDPAANLSATKYMQVPDAVVKYYEDNKTIYDTTCAWASHWYVNRDLGSAKLDVAAIDAFMSKYFVEDVEFSFEGKTGYDAYEACRSKVFTSAELLGPASSNEYFLKNYKKLGTVIEGKTLQQFRIDAGLAWLDFSNVGNMFFDETNALWGVLGNGAWGGTATKPVPVKLLDSSGKRDLKVVNAFKDDTYSPVGFIMSGNYMYFRNALKDTDGFETGSHKMYRFSINDTNPTIEDVLSKVPGNGTFEIVDYSIGGNYLYFTGVNIRGTITVGKVDLTTLVFTPFDTTYRLSNIQVY